MSNESRPGRPPLRLLTEHTASEALDDHLLRVSRETQMAVWIVTSTGRLVSRADVLGRRDLDAIVATAVGSPALPATVVEGDATYSVFDIADSADTRLRGWFLVVRGHYADWSPTALVAMSELSASASLEKARYEGGRDTWHEITDATFTLLSRGGETVTAGPHLEQIGLDTSLPLLVVAAQVDSPRDRSVDARWLITDALTAFGRPMVGLGNQRDVIALLSIDRPRLVGRVIAGLSAAVDRVAGGLGGDRLTVGISHPSPIDALTGTVRSARFARLLAVDATKPVEVISSSDVDSALLLLNSVPDSLRRTYAEHVLGPVVAYDVRLGSDLIDTLRAYFECAGSWSRTADRLGLHRNTVRYRIATVEKLTGRDLGTMPDQLDLYLALQLT